MKKVLIGLAGAGAVVLAGAALLKYLSTESEELEDDFDFDQIEKEESGVNTSDDDTEYEKCID